jgi:hypothetical protein
VCAFCVICKEKGHLQGLITVFREKGKNQVDTVSKKHE